jgi:hypothetical protein
MARVINYAVEQRLRFLEFLVVHYDSVGRDHLMDYFGISTAQATRDFRLYKELAPSNLVFDNTNKTYRVSDEFKGLYQVS